LNINIFGLAVKNHFVKIKCSILEWRP